MFDLQKRYREINKNLLGQERSFIVLFMLRWNRKKTFKLIEGFLFFKQTSVLYGKTFKVNKSKGKIYKIRMIRSNNLYILYAY